MEEEAGRYVLVGNLAEISMEAMFWREQREAGNLRIKEMTRHEDRCL